MELQTPQSVIKIVLSYSSLKTDCFEAICHHFLKKKKRHTFDLRIQNGLKTLIEMRSDLTTLASFLLFHLSSEEREGLYIDENTQYLLDALDSLRELVAIGVAHEGQSMDSVRKMLLAMSKDFRVILVVLTLRYIDLFEFDQLSPRLQRQIARETSEIFVPITGRLGIYTLKRKLEDYCFLYLSRADYIAIDDAFKARPELNQTVVDDLVVRLRDFLRNQGFKADVSGRVKGKYSTYVKLNRKGAGSIDSISDLIALRVVLKKQTDCYTVLSMINNAWQAVAGRFKDYIAMPKANGYRSLHTTVIGILEGSFRDVEIQIRTYDMHREAEFGIAAHWWYEEENIKSDKSSDQFVGRGLYQEKLQWVKNLVHFQEYLSQNKSRQAMDFFSDRIFVMTLNGRVIDLPKGSTPLDFAYALSESLGNHSFKAQVNGAAVPLDYELKNGDRVFVVRKVDVLPTMYWHSLVKTKRARMAIRKSLLEQGEDTILDSGIRMVNRELRRFAHVPLDEKYSLLRRYESRDQTFEEVKSLLISIGRGELDASEVVRSILSVQRLEKTRQFFSFTSLPVVQRGQISVAGETGFKTKISSCCGPQVGDSIRGYVTRGGFISIHKMSCKVLSSLDSERFIDVWWGDQIIQNCNVRAEVLVTRSNLLTHLSRSLRTRNIVLRRFSYDRHDHGHVLFLDLIAKKKSSFNGVLYDWKRIDGVLSVKVITL